MKLPTFIIGGAPRSGTTYLYHLCASHPDVFLAQPVAPEPKFFLVDAEYEQGLAYYAEKYYTHADRYRARGEKSTNYLENAHVAQRIHTHLPEVKLIFMLRNPVGRALSNYRWTRKNGLETLALEEALDKEPEREAAYPARYRYARPFSYISRGMYANLLRPYFALFDPAQIAIMLLDDFLTEPKETARKLFGFLEVPLMSHAFDFDQKINATDPTSEIPTSVYEHLIEVYRRPNLELAGLIGRDLNHWNCLLEDSTFTGEG